MCDLPHVHSTQNKINLKKHLSTEKERAIYMFKKKIDKETKNLSNQSF